MDLSRKLGRSCRERIEFLALKQIVLLTMREKLVSVSERRRINVRPRFRKDSEKLIISAVWKIGLPAMTKAFLSWIPPAAFWWPPVLTLIMEINCGLTF